MNDQIKYTYPCEQIINGEKCKGGYSYSKATGKMTCDTCGHDRTVQ